MARNIWSSWLDKIDYPAPGVGDLNDLEFSTHVAEDGKWIGFINTGWYYHADKEQYHYVIRGSQTVNATTASGTVTHSLSFRPSWGPVLLDGLNYQYSEHHNSFQPGTTLSWTLMGSGVYYSTIATGCVLVGMRDLTNLPLGSVAGSGELISEKFYWYNDTSRRVYVKPKVTSPIDIYADLLYQTPRLRVREIVVQTDDGVSPSYKTVEELYIIRGLQSYYTTGPATGFITHPLTGVVTGDWIVMDYNVPWSYILTSHNQLQYYTSRATGDVITISYETSIPDIVPPASLALPVTGHLNLNPLFEDAYRTGYLFHTTTALPGSSIWDVAQILVEVDKDEICYSWNETIKVFGLVLDNNGLPIPWMPVNITASSNATNLVQTPTINSSDGRGEVHCLFTCSSALPTFTVAVWVSGVTGTASANVHSFATQVPSSVYTDGLVTLVVSSDQTSRRYFQTFVNSTFLDGIPKPGSISLFTELASEFEVDATRSTKTTSFDTIQDQSSISAIKKIGYLPQPKDKIVGFCEGGQSKIISADEVT